MLSKSLLIINLLIIVINGRKFEKNFIDYENSLRVKPYDLTAAESGIIVGKKEDIKAGKLGVKSGIGFKGGVKEIESGVKKLSKSKGFVGGKKFDSIGFKGDKKLGVFDKSGKKFKKFNKNKKFNKLVASGFKKKFTSVKTFGENKGFKFGKLNGFKSAKGLKSGFGKKTKKFKDIKVKGFKKQLKTGAKKYIKANRLKGGKKILGAGKVALKKEKVIGDKKLIKKLEGKSIKG